MPPTRQQYYDTLSAARDDRGSGRIAKENAVLLLWFLRNYVGIDDLDAYEYVCDGDHDGGVDGLHLEPSSGDESHETLVIYQSKYTQGPTKVGDTAIDRLVSVANKFKTVEGLDGLLTGETEPKLVALITAFRLRAKLAEGRVADGRLRLRLVLITAGILNGPAQRAVAAVNAVEGEGYLTVHDLTRLGPFAKAVSTPEVPRRKIDVPCAAKDRVVTGRTPNRVAVATVRAADIVTWPGIADRTLFELNVRPRDPAQPRATAAGRRDRTHPRPQGLPRLPQRSDGDLPCVRDPTRQAGGPRPVRRQRRPVRRGVRRRRHRWRGSTGELRASSSSSWRWPVGLSSRRKSAGAAIHRTRLILGTSCPSPVRSSA